jgi:hypothetical protein
MTPIRRLTDSARDAAVVFLRDVGNGMLEVAHNTFAVVGLVVLGTGLFVAGHDDLRRTLESQARAWLVARHDARVATLPTVEAPIDLSEPDAIARATASDPRDLPRQQAAVAAWLSKRYKVAPEPISRLVQEAWAIGAKAKLDPTLILAVMAVESSFNPFAQSPVGAQGLMQVMTHVHDDKFTAFGGRHATFDPVTNLRVGVLVLKECIQRAGSLEAGLRHYVGAANLADDGGYAMKVLVEQNILRQKAGLPALPLPSRSAPAPAAENPPEAAVRAPVEAEPAGPAAPPAETLVRVPASRTDATVALLR